jgi:regulator-associated protein of mTOR
MYHHQDAHLDDMSYFSDNAYLNDLWHSNDFFQLPEEDTVKPTWNDKEKTCIGKTNGVVLCVCLNIGTDPPDVVKPQPCARKECWHEPMGQKSLQTIGNLLQKQYAKMTPKNSTKFKHCMDPTSDELQQHCKNLRKSVKNDRIVFHYNGHGVPRPTDKGELWVYGRNSSQQNSHYMPVVVSDLREWLGLQEPAIYILDCSGAGILIPSFVDFDITADTVTPPHRPGLSPASMHRYRPATDGSTIVLAACRGSETLPMNPQYPADIFTACLTTPIQIALRWFILSVRTCVFMCACVHMYVVMDGWMDGWMNGWMDGWMND